MDPPAQLHLCDQAPLLSQVEHPPPLGGTEDLSGGNIPVPDTVTAPLQGEEPPLLTLPEALFRLFPSGDILQGPVEVEQRTPGILDGPCRDGGPYGPAVLACHKDLSAFNLPTGDQLVGVHPPIQGPEIVVGHRLSQHLPLGLVPEDSDHSGVGHEKDPLLAGRAPEYSYRKVLGQGSVPLLADLQGGPGGPGVDRQGDLPRDKVEYLLVLFYQRLVGGVTLNDKNPDALPLGPEGNPQPRDRRSAYVLDLSRGDKPFDFGIIRQQGHPCPENILCEPPSHPPRLRR